MPTCFVLPGMGGTSLGTSPAAADNTWIDVTALAFGHFGRLRLAADGVSPGPPDGVQMYVGQLLPQYYGRCLDGLTRDLGPQGYTITPWPYDWRLDARSLGARFAVAIQQVATPAAPCLIAAHSYGGLVARIAWQILNDSGHADLIRRIVTLGTPHWGCYAVVQAWSDDSPQLDQLFWVSIASSVLGSSPDLGILGPVWTPDAIDRLVNTWPSIYLTLPSLLAPDAPSDPGRSAVYSYGWRAGLGVSPARLAEATIGWQPLMASASTQPPAAVMTTVAGQLVPTVVQLAYPGAIGSKQAYTQQPAGDGAVSVAGATLPGANQIIIAGDHQGMPQYTAASGQLAQWLLAPPPPPGPTPPPVTIAGQLAPIVAWPISTEYIVPSIPTPRDP